MPPVRRQSVRFGAQPRPGLRKLEERVADLAALKALGEECAHEGARLHRHAPDCDAQRSYAVRQVPVASAGYLVVHPATTRAIGAPSASAANPNINRGSRMRGRVASCRRSSRIRAVFRRSSRIRAVEQPAPMAATGAVLPAMVTTARATTTGPTALTADRSANTSASSCTSRRASGLRRIGGNAMYMSLIHI